MNSKLLTLTLISLLGISAQAQVVDRLVLNLKVNNPFSGSNEKDQVLAGKGVETVQLDRQDEFNLLFKGKSSTDKNVDVRFKASFKIVIGTDGLSTNRYDFLMHRTSSGQLASGPNAGNETVSTSGYTNAKWNLEGEAVHPSWFGDSPTKHVRVRYKLEVPVGVTLKGIDVESGLEIQIKADARYSRSRNAVSDLFRLSRGSSLSVNDSEHVQGLIDDVNGSGLSAIQSANGTSGIAEQLILGSGTRFVTMTSQQIVGEIYRSLLHRTESDDVLFNSDSGARNMAMNIFKRTKWLQSNPTQYEEVLKQVVAEHVNSVTFSSEYKQVTGL